MKLKLHNVTNIFDTQVDAWILINREKSRVYIYNPNVWMLTRNPYLVQVITYNVYDNQIRRLHRKAFKVPRSYSQGLICAQYIHMPFVNSFLAMASVCILYNTLITWIYRTQTMIEINLSINAFSAATQLTIGYPKYTYISAHVLSAIFIILAWIFIAQFCRFHKI